MVKQMTKTGNKHKHKFYLFAAYFLLCWMCVHILILLWQDRHESAVDIMIGFIAGLAVVLVVAICRQRWVSVVVASLVVIVALGIDLAVGRHLSSTIGAALVSGAPLFFLKARGAKQL